MKAKPEKIFVQKLKVRVSVVPFDMMRYDCCVPATEPDAHKLERVASGSATAEDHVVDFVRYSRSGNPPTIARWKSFHCEVLEWEVVRS